MKKEKKNVYNLMTTYFDQQAIKLKILF